MNYAVAIRKAAEEDLERIQDWYELHGRGLGSEFRNEIDAAISRIAAEPLSYPKSDRAGPGSPWANVVQ